MSPEYVHGQLKLHVQEQKEHNETDRKTFVNIFERLSKIEIQLGKMLVIVGILNALGGAALTIAGLLIAKRLGL